MAEKKQIVREYNVPLRKAFLKAPIYKRANRAVSALRQFLIHHMKSENIIISGEVNNFIWTRGMKHPPHHVPVTVTVEDNKILVSLRKEAHKREGKKKLKSDLKLEEIQKKKEEKLKQELEKQEKEKAEAEAKKASEDAKDISDTVKANEEKSNVTETIKKYESEEPAKSSSKSVKDTIETVKKDETKKPAKTSSKSVKTATKEKPAESKE